MDKETLGLLLGIFGFASIGVFIAWSMLNILGHPVEAQQVKDIPNEAQDKAVNGLTDAINQVEENRKQTVSNVQDPNMKNLINWVHWSVMIYIFIGILAALGIIKR